MANTIGTIVIKKVDCLKEKSILEKKESKSIPVSVTITTSIINSDIIDDKQLLLLHSFILVVKNYVTFEIQNEVIINYSTEDDWIKNISDPNSELKIPDMLDKSITNAVFYKVMPIIMILSEKMSVPMPIPPLNPMNEEK